MEANMKNGRWSKRHGTCLNCGTVSRKHKSRGYCTKCYDLMLRRETVERCDLSNPSTLTGLGSPNPPKNGDERSMRLYCQEFERWKKAELKVLWERLEYFRHRERMLRDDASIEPISLENQLSRIVDLYAPGKGSSLTHCWAGQFDEFSMEQRRILYSLFLAMEEVLPWQRQRRVRHLMSEMLDKDRDMEKTV